MVAVIVAALLGFAAAAIAPISGSVAPISGVAIGGFLAGKRAKLGPLYHGALVAGCYVVLEGIGVVPTPIGVGDSPLADSVAIIVSDAVLLATGALAGWAARREVPSSSSDTGRGR